MVVYKNPERGVLKLQPSCINTYELKDLEVHWKEELSVKPVTAHHDTNKTKSTHLCMYSSEKPKHTSDTLIFLWVSKGSL